MELKNIFKMTKTDRYTQDGRDELAKLQETEDVKYKTGDISQKTGLQKQPDGSWAPPKKGGAGVKKAAGSKKIDYQVTQKGGKFYATGHQFSDGSQLHAGPFGSEKELHEFMNGSPYKSTAESKPDAKELQRKLWNAGYKFNVEPSQGLGWESKGNYSIGSVTSPEGKKMSMEEAAAELEAKSKPAARKSVDKEKLLDALSFDLVDTTADIEEEYNAIEHSDNSRLPEFVRQEIERDYVNKTNGEKWTDEEKDIIAEEVTRRIKQRQSEDEAPKIRELTGDCKIKIRPETQDKVYQIGEISQKTGLQKTANGWRPVKKNGAAAGSTETKQEYKGPTNPDHDEILQKMKSAEGYGHVKNIGDYEVYRVTSGPEKGKYKVSLKGSNEEMTMSENQAAKYLLNQKRLNERSSQTEAKPDAAETRNIIGTEIKESLEAARYYLDKANSFYPSDPSYKTYMEKAKKAHDEAKAQADDNGFYFEEMNDPGVTRAIKKYSEGNKSDKVGDFSNKDSAPRVLTGDTRIRVKK